jgi:cytochrome c oxidase subunit IV
MTSTRHNLYVTAALMALLAMTLAAAYVHLGRLNTSVAMLIALSKAALIAIFFMNLRRTNPVARLFALAGAFWLLILLGLTLSDFLTRR